MTAELLVSIYRRRITYLASGSRGPFRLLRTHYPHRAWSMAFSAVS